MESKQSVIARLIGFDEALPPQPFCEQRISRRILSEDYLQKMASIGVWENSSFSVKKNSDSSLEYDQLLEARRHSDLCKPSGKTIEVRHSSVRHPKSDLQCPKQSQKHYVKLGDERIVIPEKKSASRFYKFKLGLSRSSSESPDSATKTVCLMTNPTNHSIGNSISEFDNIRSESSACALSPPDVLSSYNVEASLRQESFNGSPLNVMVPLKHTTIDQNSPKELNQSSPNSVLEPHFKGMKLPKSECFEAPVLDLHSVVEQLELLENNSEETYSEASEMALSVAENAEKRESFYSSQEQLGLFSSEESRDFSYLVDILDEARLNFEVDLETCDSLEFPINPLLFEALEMKYGKQVCWSKPERRLLFDRINSGLSQILNSFMDIHIVSKSLKMSFYPTLRRSEVEEELCVLLVSEEKEARKDMSEKGLGVERNWLKMEREREICVICEELENCLFIELASELYCV
ncbi:unnamed protein product [Cuscuta epithymum]|uniref:DUF4378 domain-containing protein n=2 Tax=Cuscuta epithymum TaxID=186058 RepID=A0AAV0DVI2_9ASTE|nr:unnamed protein product [Cuscuta epithymum]